MMVMTMIGKLEGSKHALELGKYDGTYIPVVLGGEMVSSSFAHKLMDIISLVTGDLRQFVFSPKGGSAEGMNRRLMVIQCTIQSESEYHHEQVDHSYSQHLRVRTSRSYENENYCRRPAYDGTIITRRFDIT